MKKRVEKQPKPAAGKNGATRKQAPARAVAPNPHDQLHSLLRVTYAYRVCVQRRS